MENYYNGDELNVLFILKVYIRISYNSIFYIDNIEDKFVSLKESNVLINYPVSQPKGLTF
jgi:hypothetical protein